MAISVVDSAGAADNSGATTYWDWAAGSSVVPGDLRLAFASAPAGTSIATPTGWTQLFYTTYASGETGIWSHVYSPSDAVASFHVESTYAVVGINLRGAGGINVGPTGAFDGGGVSTAPTAPTVTTTIANCLLLSWFACTSPSGGSDTATMTDPGGQTRAQYVHPGTVLGHIGLLTYEQLGAAGATGTRVAGVSSAPISIRTASVAIVPADPTRPPFVAASQAAHHRAGW